MLEPGTYDITILYPTATTVGCIVPNNCYLVGNGYREEVILSGILGAADTQWSPVNMTKNCGLFNLTVQAKNARYCVHDDMSEEGEYTRVIDNCVFKGEDLSLRWAYGAGTRAGNKTLLSNCLFINNNGNFSIHNRVGAEYPNLIELNDCSFIQYAYGDNPYDIMLACMNIDGDGVTTHGDVNVNVHNCNANIIYSVTSAGYVSFFNINCDNPDTALFSAYDPQRINCAGTIKCVNSQSLTRGTLVTFTSFNKVCQKFETSYTKAFANGVTISDTSADGLNEVLVRTKGYVTGNEIGIAVQPSKFLNYDSGTDALVVENTEGAIPVAYGLASGVWKLVL